MWFVDYFSCFDVYSVSFDGVLGVGTGRLCTGGGCTSFLVDSVAGFVWYFDRVEKVYTRGGGRLRGRTFVVRR